MKRRPLNRLAIAKKHLQLSETLQKVVETTNFTDKVSDDSLRKDDKEFSLKQPASDKKEKQTLKGGKEKIIIDPYLRVMTRPVDVQRNKYRED